VDKSEILSVTVKLPSVAITFVGGFGGPITVIGFDEIYGWPAPFWLTAVIE